MARTVSVAVKKDSLKEPLGGPKTIVLVRSGTSPTRLKIRDVPHAKSKKQLDVTLEIR